MADDEVTALVAQARAWSAERHATLAGLYAAAEESGGEARLYAQADERGADFGAQAWEWLDRLLTALP